MRVALPLLLLALSFPFASIVASVAVAQDNLPEPATGAPAEGAANADPQFEQKVSYSIGLDLGRRLRTDNIPVDLKAIVSGLRDGLTDAKPMLSDEQMTAVMEQFQAQMQQKAESKMADIAGENQSRGEAFLKENATKEGIQTTDSGLQYRVIEEGTGPSPGPNDTVSCHYEGKLINGEVFDSSYKRGEPVAFPVGGVIAGWTEALQMMKTGAKWELFLPPSIAYGTRGAPGAIGPNETLIFQVELLDIVK